MLCLYCTNLMRDGTTKRRRRYCSQDCNAKAANARARAKRARPAVECPTCRDSFTPVRVDQSYCSRRCWNVSRGRALLHPPAPAICALDGCTVEFQPRKTSQRCCSEAHGKKLWHAENPEANTWTDARRDAWHRRRALKHAASTGRPVLLSEIKARDKNHCHLCGDRVPAKVWPHPLSPSLDHVIPLSKGGAHDPDNVKLAHLRCNVAKGDRGGNEQLLLIG